MSRLCPPRRAFLASLAAGSAAPARAASPLLRLAAGPHASPAGRYGAALCESLGAAGPVRVAPRHTLGSTESLYLLERGQVQFALASLDSLAQAATGQGSFAPQRLRRLRALAPASGAPLRLHSALPGPWRGLAGRRLGCAPPGGPAEGLVTTIARALEVELIPQAEDPASLGALLAEGRLDALLLAPGQEAAPFGPALARLPLLAMAPGEQALLAAALPGLGPAELAPGVPGLAAWWLLLANAGLAAAWAEPVAELALAHPPAPPADTLPGPASPEANPVLPWHPGAYPAWERRGVALPA